ncbi:MAG: phosphatase PAP2 family protein [Pirellulaceae bacterium]|nr:phosphatase PAP2 family protein [Pirellulaceae bacterium]
MVDLEVVDFFQTDPLPGEISRIVTLSEVFAYGVGVAFFLFLVYFFDPAQRRRLPRLITVSLGAGLAANSCKLVLARQRPWAHLETTSPVSTTFGDWFPFLGDQWGSAWQSLPSAHSATVIGLAVGLFWCYPRGKWLFFSCAALSSFQRIADHAHHVSDVFWGLGVGLAWAYLFLKKEPIWPRKWILWEQKG